MESEGAYQQATRLRKGGYPGLEETGYYARIFGGSIIIRPLDDPEAIRMAYGPVSYTHLTLPTICSV
eukprot:6715460-Prorocentrum_lima.AAC.1